MIFLDAELMQELRRDPAAALRTLADEIEAGRIALFAPSIQGNGLLQSRWGRIVMDLRCSLEVKISTSDKETFHDPTEEALG